MHFSFVNKSNSGHVPRNLRVGVQYVLGTLELPKLKSPLSAMSLEKVNSPVAQVANSVIQNNFHIINTRTQMDVRKILKSPNQMVSSTRASSQLSPYTKQYPQYKSSEMSKDSLEDLSSPISSDLPSPQQLFTPQKKAHFRSSSESVFDKINEAKKIIADAKNGCSPYTKPQYLNQKNLEKYLELFADSAQTLSHITEQLYQETQNLKQECAALRRRTRKSVYYGRHEYPHPWRLAKP